MKTSIPTLLGAAFMISACVLEAQPAAEPARTNPLFADSPAAPTFANTIEAMERSGALLTRASKIFFNLAQSNTNDAFQKIEAEESPKLAAHQDAIYMNPKLYARVKALYDKRATSGLDAESQ